MTDAPCEPWPIDTTCWSLPTEPAPEVIDHWRRVASQVLWSLSGRRWGLCTETVRPCRRACTDGLIAGLRPGEYMRPYTFGGEWRNALVACGCANTCGCQSLCEVDLPGPVDSVTAVLLDGAVVDPDDYFIRGNKLARRGDGCWPTCQDLSAPDDAEGAFTVTYRRGLALTPAAIAANSELTEELLRACIPDCECALPRRIVSQAMQGLDTEYVNPQDFISGGKTGLYLTDLWLEAVNPYGLRAPSRVYSPDVPRGG